MADCIVTMNLGHGADVITRSKVRVRRLERGDNGEFVVAAGWSDVPTGRPFTTWTGEQGVVYQVDEQGGIPGGVVRTVELPAEATAAYSDLVDVVPLPASPGVLGDQVIATAIGTPGTASNDILVETIAADPTVVDAAAAAVQGAGLDTAAADLINTDGTASQEAVTAQSAALSRNAYNPLQSPNPLRSGVGDGTSHPLSGRFATLADAQAAFPRATALAEEIDEHAIQWGLDHYGTVICPGGFTYMFSGLMTVYTSAADSARPMGDQAFVCEGTLKLRDGATARTLIASGNFRTSTIGAPRTTAQVPLLSKLKVHIRELDGNKANTVAGSSANLPAIAIMHVNVVDLDWWVRDFRGVGSSTWGVLDSYSTQIIARRIWISGCTGQYAAQFSNRLRRIFYADVMCWDNDGDGMFWDHSEGTSASIRAWNNKGTGIRLRNVGQNICNGLTAYDNGFRGVQVSGNDACVGSGWNVFDNGTLADAAGLVNGEVTADLYFDATDGSHGITANSEFRNIKIGGYGRSTLSTPKTAAYGVYMEDGITGPNVLEVAQLKNNVIANYRLPADPGKLTFIYSASGESTKTTVVGGGSGGGGGSTPVGGVLAKIKSGNQVVNNTITPTAITDLDFPVLNGETWEVEWGLYVQSATAADVSFTLDCPTPKNGRFGVDVGLVVGQTGGSGDANPSATGLTTAHVVGTTTSPWTRVIVRAVIVLGAITSPPQTVRLQFAQAVANASDTTVQQYSTMTARRIA